MTSLQDFMRRQSEMIDRVGWSVTLVHPADDGHGHDVPFAYTVGFTAHDHPELLIAGLDAATAQALLNELAGRVYDKAERFSHGQRVSDLIADYDAVIVDGPACDALYPGAAFARYGDTRVRLQQIVWPDPRGCYPWDADYTYDADVQPVIGHP
ncbi:DUF4262 domain-containing protein [Micromonospora sp. NPDC049051]|uniref:DUF4262 domain-containing protein n=1 Tax=Micromonospora sp. NPDC049051 TaxID=3364264 RepID=UPI003719D4A9